MRSVVWAHGRSDARRGASPELYARCLRALITGWRDAGPTGDYAWSIAQIGPPRGGAGPREAETVAALRLAQASALPAPVGSVRGALDTTALSPSYDLLGFIGNASELGRRLALGVAHAAYGKQEPLVHWAAPTVGRAAAAPFRAGAAVDLCVAPGAERGYLALVDVDGGECATAGEGPLVQASSSHIIP